MLAYHVYGFELHVRRLRDEIRAQRRVLLDVYALCSGIEARLVHQALRKEYLAEVVEQGAHTEGHELFSHEPEVPAQGYREDADVHRMGKGVVVIGLEPGEACEGVPVPEDAVDYVAQQDRSLFL